MMDVLKEKLKEVDTLFSLKGKVALITGGGRGLGRGIGLAMAASGADVVPVDLNYENSAAVSKEIQYLGRNSIPLVADITNEAEVQTMTRQVVEEMGRIDILVNSVGTLLVKPTVKYTLKEWEYVIRTNVSSFFLCSKEVGKVMLKQKRGKIINLSSAVTRQGRLSDPAYSTSKAGANSLTKSLAIEWARYGIQVNAIAPTFTRTDLSSFLLDEQDFMNWALEQIPMGRIGQIWDIFGAAIFLASAASDFVTGHVLHVDGGWKAA